MFVHIIANLPGIVMVGSAFGISFGIGHLVDISKDGPLMIIASPLLIAADVIYRARKAERQWFHPNGGGMLFFVPIWLWGIWWLLLGIGYMIVG